MSEKPESNPASFSKREASPRRRAIIGSVALAFSAALNALLPRKAEAQGLFPTNPPDIIPAGTGIKTEKPVTNKDISVPTEKDLERVRKQLLEVSKEKIKLARNFIPDPGSEQSPNIKPDFGTNNDKSFAQLVLETGEQVSLWINNKNKNKGLPANLNLGIEKYAGIDLDSFANGLSSEFQMSRLSELAYLFDFSNYSDGVSGGNIYRERSDLAETFLVKGISIWMNQPDQLLNKLNQIPPASRPQMASVSLFILKLLDNCANNPHALEKLRIKEKTLSSITKLSAEDYFVDHFKGKGI